MDKMAWRKEKDIKKVGDPAKKTILSAKNVLKGRRCLSRGGGGEKSGALKVAEPSQYGGSRGPLEKYRTCEGPEPPDFGKARTGKEEKEHYEKRGRIRKNQFWGLKKAWNVQEKKERVARQGPSQLRDAQERLSKVGKRRGGWRKKRGTGGEGKAQMKARV